MSSSQHVRNCRNKEYTVVCACDTATNTHTDHVQHMLSDYTITCPHMYWEMNSFAEALGTFTLWDEHIIFHTYT